MLEGEERHHDREEADGMRHGPVRPRVKPERRRAKNPERGRPCGRGRVFPAQTREEQPHGEPRFHPVHEREDHNGQQKIEKLDPES